MLDDAPHEAFVQEADCAERVVVLKARVPGRGPAGTSFVIVAATRAGGGAGLASAEERRGAWGGRLPPRAPRQRPPGGALRGARPGAPPDAAAARAPRGATKLVVTDWSSGEAVKVEVPLDPARGAREQVDAMFKRAKRLRLGARIANQRLAATDAQLVAVARATDDARTAVD